MEIITDKDIVNIKNSAITVGTFDGVHRGHYQILSCLRNTAKSTSGNSIVFTFNQHPRDVLNTTTERIKQITTFQEKAELLAKHEIDYLYAIDFTPEFARIKYDEFVKQYLVEKFKINNLVIGYDHQFGYRREGEISSISELAKKYNFSITQVEAFAHESVKISSTKIRNALAGGEIEKANSFLGYNYKLSGTVIEGKKIGRQIGFPTANIQVDTDSKLIPGTGVYAVKVKLNNNYLRGVLNIGTRPTLNDGYNISIEVNIFDFNSEIYGSGISVEFISKLRNEQKFETIDALKEQIAIDKVQAKLILS